MPLGFNVRVFLFNAPRSLIRRILLLLLTLSLLTAALAAQSEQETKRAEADKLFGEGLQLYKEGSKGSLEQALQKFEQARPLLHSINAASEEALVLLGIGAVYSLLGEKQKALDSYALALPLLRAAGQRGVEATTLNNIGGVYDSLGEKQKALDNFALALPLYRAVGERNGEATTLANIGQVYSSLGEKQKALDNFALALPLFRATGDRSAEATVLTNIGAVYNDLGEKQKALDNYALALPLRRAVGDRDGEANTLNNIGAVYDSLGEKQKALDNYVLALPLIRAAGDRGGEAAVLDNIGGVNDAIGEKQQALDNFALALALRRAVGDRGGEATTLTSIGKVYDSLGEKQKALDSYALALPLRRAVGDRDGEATTLNNIGLVYSSLGEKQKALANYALALPLLHAVGNRRMEATTLNNIGAVYDDLGEKQKALDNYALALELYRAVGDRGGEAVTLNNIGAVYNNLGEKQKALDNFALALALRRAVGDRGGEALTLFNVAYLERDQGKLIEARANIEAAISIIESLRTKIANQELRASYFATVQDYYEFYIDLLMRLHKQSPNAGHDGEALQTSERARARALLETLAEANSDIRQGVDPKLVERERKLQIQLNAKAQGQLKLLSGAHTDEQAKTIAAEIEALTTEFQQVETQIKQTSPRYAALTQPQPLTGKEIQTQLLDADTLLLEYSLGKDHSYLWAVTPTSITSYELPKREEIEAVARQVYALLADKESADDALVALRSGKTDSKKPKPTVAVSPTRSPREQAQTPPSSEAATRLSQMLLAQIANQLGSKRLLIVADGALQYIPLGALPSPIGRSATDEYQPLIVGHEIVTLPSASALAVLRQEVKGRKPANKTVAVLADPVFESDDERVKQVNGQTANPGTTAPSKKRELPLGMERAATESGLRSADSEIPRLPGTRDEARQILALVPTTEGKQALDFSASRQMAMSPELSQYRYVHFATHGFLDSLHPELSGIVFSMIDEKGNPQDGFLRAHEVFNLKLPAELVVLSACQTGLGKEVKGEGLVGLTRGFMYAGAPRVVVSLWSVNDQATAELMARFYRGMLKDKLRPAAALRAAQISLMKEKGWQSPFYWAAFTLQGEWR